MQCITPMIRYYQDIPKTNPDEKLAQKIVPRHEVYERLKKNENLITGLQRLNDELEKKGSVWRYQTIPCNNCYACQLRRSADWATRIMKEVSEHEHNYFITFTYNELNLPIAEKTTYNEITYENPGDWTGTLDPTDMTKFIAALRMKLRRQGHKGLKYYYAGEYCPSSGRPHYHAILMNCPLDITKFYNFKMDNSTRTLHWRSKEIEKLWSKGFIDISEVTFASAAYVARYTMKKISNDINKSVYYEQGKLPEFTRMSRRPGIGAEYFNKNMKKIYDTDSILMRNYHGEITHLKPPKAWDRKFQELYPEQWENIKKSREEAAKRSQKLIKEMTNASDLQKLEQKAQEIMTKANQLPRGMEYDI